MARKPKTQPVRQAGSAGRFDLLFPIGLFILFLALTLPGIAWGAPAGWHPDEVVYVAINALYEGMEFDASNYNHPHLPIYLMLGLGQILTGLGGDVREVLIGARLLSAVFAGLTVVLAYVIPRRMGHGPGLAALSGVLLLSVSEMAHNGRFAHNDTFVTFFSALTVYFLVEYVGRGYKAWLYAGFCAAGLAISSKYSAVSLAVLPPVVYLWTRREHLRESALQLFETLFSGGALTFLGYAAGTPQALLWMAYYFKRVGPALLYNANYGRQPDSVIGVIGQYSVLADGIGIPLLLLFGAGFVWACYRVVRAFRAGVSAPLVVVLLGALLIELPIAVSYNFPIRFFLPLMPLLAILSALFLGEVHETLQRNGSLFQRRLAGATLILVLTYSLARSVSVMLLFLNDARIPATAYVASLPDGTSLEHTEYPPAIPSGHFDREHNYPLFFIKAADQEVPTGTRYPFNAGEAGLLERNTDYLVIDSFTAAKLADPYTCEAMPLECAFFADLEIGKTDHYRLIRQFSYRLPPWLPRIQVAFVNPQIRIYERYQ